MGAIKGDFIMAFCLHLSRLPVFDDKLCLAMYIHLHISNVVMVFVAFFFDLFPKGEMVELGGACVNIENMFCEEGCV